MFEQDIDTPRWLAYIAHKKVWLRHLEHSSISTIQCLKFLETHIFVSFFCIAHIQFELSFWKDDPLSLHTELPCPYLWSMLKRWKCGVCESKFRCCELLTIRRETRRALAQSYEVQKLTRRVCAAPGTHKQSITSGICICKPVEPGEVEEIASLGQSTAKRDLTGLLISDLQMDSILIFIEDLTQYSPEMYI